MTDVSDPFTVVSKRRKYHAVSTRKGKGGQSIWARRFAHHVQAFTPVDPTPAQVAGARNAAALAVSCEKLEVQLAGGDDIDVDVYGRATGQLRRSLRALGLIIDPTADVVAADPEPVAPDYRTDYVGWLKHMWFHVWSDDSKRRIVGEPPEPTSAHHDEMIRRMSDPEWQRQRPTERAAPDAPDMVRADGLPARHESYALALLIREFEG